MGFKPCLHPLLAVLAEARLVVQLWLRAGSTHCGNNVVAFFLDLWEQRRGMCGCGPCERIAGFVCRSCSSSGSSCSLPYIVVAKLTVDPEPDPQ
jgi:hypothetical protein